MQGTVNLLVHRRSFVAAAVFAAFLVGPVMALDTERVNRNSSGVQSALGGGTAWTTPDGRFVVFSSIANDLVPGDTNGHTDIFVRDRLLGTTARVNLPDPSTGNAQANGGSQLTHGGARVISDNGRFVVFTSDADNLVAGDTNLVSDVFVRDRDLDGNGIFDEPGIGMTRTVRVSLTSNESQSFGACPNQTCTHGAYGGTISADGRYVAFVSEFNFAGSEAFTNIYRRDRDADNDGIYDEAGGAPDAAVTILVTPSISCQGCEHNGFTDSPAISANGRHIAFRSASSRQVFSDFNQAIDIFVRDVATATTTRMSVRIDGLEGEPNSDSGWPSISDNGRYVAFHSANDDLDPADNGNLLDCFVRDRDTDNDGIFDEAGQESLERVSLGFTSFPLPGQTVPLNNHSLNASISGDGRYVAFQSDATNNFCGLLSCEDNNNRTDILVRDRQIGRTFIASLDNDGGQANGNSITASISKTGRFVGFNSAATDLATPDGNGALADPYVRGFVGASNSLCAGSIHITPGMYTGDTWGAGVEGSTTCSSTDVAPDVWYTFTASCNGEVTIDTIGSSYDTLLSVHSSCPGVEGNQIACNDDIGPSLDSRVNVFVAQGQTYTIRVSGFSFHSGFFKLTLGDCRPCCPGNADKIAPGSVTFGDVTAVLTSFGMVYAMSGPGDADCDGTVNFGDVTSVLTHFGSVCP